VKRSPDGVNVEIAAYIDSGPRVSKSETHLMPDGEYQASMLELLQCCDPEIEHVGSWHSHHCNGLKDLSTGDIRGYFASVNHRDYNLDHFLALLITGLDRRGLQFRAFLFERGTKEYREILVDSIRETGEVYSLNSLLIASAHVAFARRREISRGGNDGHSHRNEPPQDESAVILADDRHWISRLFPAAAIVRNKRTGELRWRWQVVSSAEAKGVTIEYVYPLRIAYGATAVLIARIADAEVFRQSVAIADGRFSEMEDFLRPLRVDPIVMSSESATESARNQIEEPDEKRVEWPNRERQS